MRSVSFEETEFPHIIGGEGWNAQHLLLFVFSHIDDMRTGGVLNCLFVGDFPMIFQYAFGEL